MAAAGQLLPPIFGVACVDCARRPELALSIGSPSSAPEVRAGLPVKTTPTSIASRPADGQAAALLMSVGRASSGHGHPAKTTSTAIASGLGPAPSEQRLDNRKLMVVAKPSSRPRGHLRTHATTHERTPGSCFWSRSVEVSVPPWRRSLYSSLDLMQ
jgi:hypothetical protein